MRTDSSRGISPGVQDGLSLANDSLEKLRFEHAGYARLLQAQQLDIMNAAFIRKGERDVRIGAPCDQVQPHYAGCRRNRRVPHLVGRHVAFHACIIRVV
jgi:hypothetical protein